MVSISSEFKAWGHPLFLRCDLLQWTSLTYHLIHVRSERPHQGTCNFSGTLDLGEGTHVQSNQRSNGVPRCFLALIGLLSCKYEGAPAIISPWKIMYLTSSMKHKISRMQLGCLEINLSKAWVISGSGCTTRPAATESSIERTFKSIVV